MIVYRLATLAIAVATLFAQSVIAGDQCSKPSVRREWRSLTSKERTEWIDAVKCIHALPHNSSLVPTFNTTYTVIPPVNASSTHYDDWVYIHMDLNPLIHFTGQFLPWHRAYIKDFETALRQKCGYEGTQPYWNWTLDAANFENSTWWNPNPTSGVGGWGVPEDDYQIADGAFVNFTVSYPIYHRLRRQYTPSTPTHPEPYVDSFTPESQEAMVNGFVGDFLGFQALFQGGSHAAIHGIVGGDLLGGCPSNAPGCVPGPKWSPNDPLFMMHHTMVDKLWYDWQKANPSNFWSFTGGSVALVNNFVPDPTFPTGGPPMMNFSTPVPTDGIMEDYTVYELMDPLTERLCYTYE